MPAYIILVSKVFISFSLLLITTGFLSVIFIDVLIGDSYSGKKTPIFRSIINVPFRIGFSLGITFDKVFNLSGDNEED